MFGQNGKKDKGKERKKLAANIIFHTGQMFVVCKQITAYCLEFIRLIHHVIECARTVPYDLCNTLNWLTLNVNRATIIKLNGY